MISFKNKTNKRASKLIESGDLDQLVKELDAFKNLDFDIADILITNRYGNDVIDNLASFNLSDNLRIFNRLIHKGLIGSAIQNVSKFIGINNQELAIHLIDEGHGEQVVDSLKKFEDLDLKAIVDALIRKKLGNKLSTNLEKFEGVEHRYIADSLIANEGGKDLANNFDVLRGLNSDNYATKLTDSGNAEDVFINIAKFKDLDIYAFAKYLIHTGNGSTLVDNIDLYNAFTHDSFAKLLIAKGDIDAVSHNLERFQYLEFEIAKIIIEKNRGEFIPKNINSFSNQYHPLIAVRLIENGLAHLVDENIDKFEGIKDWKQTDDIKIESDRNISVLRYPNYNYKSNSPGVEATHHLAVIVEVNDGHQQFFGEQEQVLLEVKSFLEALPAMEIGISR